MTKKERVMAVFRNEQSDRLPLKLWGFQKGQHMLHPAYKPIHDLAVELTEHVDGGGVPFDIICGDNSSYKHFREQEDSEWQAVTTIIKTPKGDLRSVALESNIGNPGYVREYFIKNSDDLDKLLSIKYEPFSYNPKWYEEAYKRVGDEGIAMYTIDHPAYALQRLTGSEQLGYLLYDDYEKVKEVVDCFAERLQNDLKRSLDNGISKRKDKDFVVGYVGPELWIPPLVRLEDFENFVWKIDAKTCELVKNAGGYVWVHSHGKMKGLIDRFAIMGVDVINPIEPPPMGNVTLDDAIFEAAGKIGLEGNLEINDLILKDEDYIRDYLEKLIPTAAEYKRFIVCPSAGYMEYIEPSESYLKNLEIFLRCGHELVCKFGKM